jgi:hypothetical protein
MRYLPVFSAIRTTPIWWRSADGGFAMRPGAAEAEIPAHTINRGYVDQVLDPRYHLPDAQTAKPRGAPGTGCRGGILPLW